MKRLGRGGHLVQQLVLESNWDAVAAAVDDDDDAVLGMLGIAVVHSRSLE